MASNNQHEAIRSDTSPLDSSGQPLDDHNTTSTIIRAATTVSLILLGLTFLFTVLKVTTWLRKKSEYSRLRAVEARVSQLEYLDLSSTHRQHHLRTQNNRSNLLPDSLTTKTPPNHFSHHGNKKLRNLFDIQEYEGTPA